MTESQIEVIIKQFDFPDEVTQFPKGKFETVTLGGRQLVEPRISQAGNGQLMLALTLVKIIVASNMLVWLCQVLRPQHSQMAR